MKIHSENPVSALHGLFDRINTAERAVRTAAPASACGTGQASGPVGDGLEVSARAWEIAGLKDAIGGLPEVRQSLVDRLREEIAGGLYHADGRRIADAMLDEERAFASRAGTGRP
jgi:flagellar biosynthesis anti-sigma factor FlgM